MWLVHNREHQELGIIMGYRLDVWDSIPNKIKRFVSAPWHPCWPLDTLSFLSIGYEGLFPKVKWLGCEAEHSPQPAHMHGDIFKS
jgi:hypothetical protein